jgi:hypothetical protein
MVVISNTVSIATVSRHAIEESAKDQRVRRFWDEVDAYDRAMTDAGRDLTPRLS